MDEGFEMPAPPHGRRRQTEKKIDNVLASWEGGPLPEGAVVTHVMLLPYRGDRCVLAWREGLVDLPAGTTMPGERVEAAVRRVALEQAGIAELEMTDLGHWTCKATPQSSDPPGTITYRPVFGVEVKALADFPSGEGYERRIVQQRDLVATIRTRHTEIKVELTEALDAFIVQRTKAARGG